VLPLPGGLPGLAGGGGEGACAIAAAAAGCLEDFLLCLVIDSLGVGTWDQRQCLIPDADALNAPL